ncbi:MAG: 6-carboxytetrahydropterin synthase QueD [Candidatus Eutrophobiaceae bacterium]
MKIYKRFSIEAAHWLPHLPDDHKCSRMHGHSFQISVCVKGKVDPQSGWVMDFSTIAKAFEPLHKQLDHHCLNEIEDLANPTSENLAIWIWQRLAPSLPCLHSVEIMETCTSGCIYEGTL